MRIQTIAHFMVLFLMCSTVIADDVVIDGSGNIVTGTSGIDGNLEVTGTSGEDGVVGFTSGTGAAGVYGINTTNNNYGLLGDDNFGVYGNSSLGYAGYFEGNTRVTGVLTVDGGILGTGVGDITGVTAGTGLGGGGTSGEVTLTTDTTYVQRRVSSSCTVGSSIRAINQDGTVICETDNGITIESDPKVGSLVNNFVPKWNGTSLLNGTIYDDGNIGIGDSAPSEKLTVDGNINVTGQIQSSVATGTAPLQVSSTTMVENLNSSMLAGKRLNDLDSRYGKIDPPQNPHINIITSHDTAINAGRYPSITIGMDGRPIISYFTTTGFFDLKVIKCGNTSCTSGNTITTVDSQDNVGKHNANVIGADGLLVISYYDDTNGDLKILKCGDSACSAGNTITQADTEENVGYDTSITIGTDGLPVISYLDYTNFDLKILKCGNAACSSGNIMTAVDTDGDVGSNTSIIIGTDGLPVVSYLDSTNFDLKILKCGNSSCSAGNTITTADSAGNVGEFTSITIGTDGLPIVSYYDDINEDLKVLKCGNAACSANNTISTLDTVGSTGWFTSITIGSDGLPIISFKDHTNFDLKMIKCGNAACSANNTMTVLDTAGNVGRYTSITIGMDGLPIISYYDLTNGDLKVLKCGNQFCLNNWVRR